MRGGHLLCVVAFASLAFGAEPGQSIDPSALTAIGKVDRRFQSYNIEMVEVTGGRFWKPYKDFQLPAKPQAQQNSGNSPSSIPPNLFEYRPPIDLSNARLRKLAAPLGPAYVRVSGTWANSTYFYDQDGPPPKTPPAGYGSVLTRAEWKGVVDFAHAVNADIMTSFATSVGTRNAEGVWTPDEARTWIEYTKSIGGAMAAAEFMNEPTFASIGGAPKGYDAAAYGRDIRVFVPFLKHASSGTVFLGPSSVGEGGHLVSNMPNALSTEALMQATGPVYDVFSFHIYGAVSLRCSNGNPQSGTTADAALSQDWLLRARGIAEYYKRLRDQFEPGKPMWVTETADAACGGDPWASTFMDTFRYLAEHASLAQMGISLVAHNTLAASDYGLLDEHTYMPRPNYWAALLWNRLMGETVLKAPGLAAPNLYVYAQCTKGAPGGVTVLAMNTDRHAAKSITVPSASERYTLSAKQLESKEVQLNGKALELGPGDSLPGIAGASTASGSVKLPPASITFLAIPQAHNASCGR